MTPLRIVVCEGYHDRAFWSAWLTGPLGWQSREEERDPWDALGNVRGGGVFGFARPGRHLRVVPAQGRSKLVAKARSLVERARTVPALDALVVCIDTDAPPGDDAPRGVDLARTLGSGARTDPPLRLGAVEWRCGDPASLYLPEPQTLERLVCAALAEAHPERASAVSAWLQGGPETHRHKQHAWSHMARWYPDSGCDDFWRRVWDDAAVAAGLERRLRESGAWAVAESLGG